MKLKITSIAIALLMTLSLSGQKNEYSFKKHSKKEKTEHQRESDALRFQNLPYHTHNPKLKSSLDEKSSLDQRDYLLWDEDASDWLIYNQEDYTYGVNGSLSQYIYQEWNDGQDALLLDYRVDFSYDANDNYSINKEYAWDDISEEWKNNWLTMYTFNASGEISLIMDSAFYNDQWVPWEKREFTYANGNMIEYLYHEFEIGTSTWLEEDYEEMTYDMWGNRILLFDYDWNESTLAWDSAFKVVDSYDAYNYLTESIEYEWDDLNEEWAKTWKYVYFNDSNGFVVIETEYIWLEDWDENRKTEYTYDVGGNPISEQIYAYDSNSDGLIYDTKYTYTYDVSIHLDNLLFPPMHWFAPDYPERISHKPLSFLNEDYDKNLVQWYNYAKAVYRYDVEDATAVREIEYDASMEVYPNPVGGFLSFRLEEYRGELSFELYDMTGRRVMIRVLSSGETMNMEQFSRGVYLYQISAEGKIKRGKLIKK